MRMHKAQMRSNVARLTSKLSEMPLASFARVLALNGAKTNTSAH